MPNANKLSPREWDALLSLILNPFKAKISQFFQQSLTSDDLYSHAKRIGDSVLRPESYREKKKQSFRMLSAESIHYFDSDIDTQLLVNRPFVMDEEVGDA
jgi:hypothetical protein